MTTLAHLSDVHLAPRGWPEWRLVDAKRALGLLNWHRGRKRIHRADVLAALLADLARAAPDHVAVTGDLVNTAFPGELAHAATWLAGLGAAERVTVIPGNHDIYSKLVGRDEGVERWRAWMRADADGARLMDGRTGDDGFPFVRVIGRVALLALNSAHPTPLFVAAGELGPTQRTIAAALLRRLGEDGYCRVVLIHHPPLPGQAVAKKALADAAEMRALLAEEGAELVLHGHNHLAMTAEVEPGGGRPPIPVIGVPSASHAPSSPEKSGRYNLYEIGGGPGRWRIEMHGRGIRADGSVTEVEHRVLSGPAR